ISSGTPVFRIAAVRLFSAGPRLKVMMERSTRGRAVCPRIASLANSRTAFADPLIEWASSIARPRMASTTHHPLGQEVGHHRHSRGHGLQNLQPRTTAGTKRHNYCNGRGIKRTNVINGPCYVNAIRGQGADLGRRVAADDRELEIRITTGYLRPY